jgi:hypothetical protein
LSVGGVKSLDRCLSQSDHKLNQPLPNFWHSYSHSVLFSCVALRRRHCCCCCCSAVAALLTFTRLVRTGPIIHAPRDFRGIILLLLFLFFSWLLTSWLLSPPPRLLVLVTACRH